MGAHRKKKSRTRPSEAETVRLRAVEQAAGPAAEPVVGFAGEPIARSPAEPVHEPRAGTRGQPIAGPPAEPAPTEAPTEALSPRSPTEALSPRSPTEALSPRSTAPDAARPARRPAGRPGPEQAGAPRSRPVGESGESRPAGESGESRPAGESGERLVEQSTGLLPAVSPTGSPDGALVEAAPTVRVRTIFRRFWPDTRGFRGRLVVGLMLVAVPPALAAAGIWLFKILVDEVLATRDVQRFPVIAAAFVAITLLEGIVGFIDEYLSAWVAERFVLNLRGRVFNHLQRLSLTFFEKRQLGDILSRLTGDVSAIEQLLLSGVSQALTYLFQIIFFAGALFILDWRLALAALAAAPAFLLLARFFARRIKEASRERRRRAGSITAVAEESLHNAALVQAYHRQSHETARFHRENLGSFTAQMLATKLEALFSPFTDLLEAIGVLLVIGFGIHELINGRITLGGLLVFIGYLTQLYGPITGFGDLVNSIYAASAGAERIIEILDAEPDVRDPVDPRPLGKVSGAVRLERVGFRYPEVDRPALAEISFTAEPGETIAVVGPSGAGKSTLLRILLRLHDPSAGAVTLDGIDIRQVRLSELRGNIAAVLQDTLVFDGTVAENIRWGKPDATPSEVVTAAKAADAHRFITGLPGGYEARIGQRGMMLSGGQRQRIALARAMIRNAPVLLLDEPTTGLDAISTQRVMEPLRRAMSGRTTIVISHNLLTVADADRIVYLERGRVAGYGTHSELLISSPGYAELYRLNHPEPFRRPARPDPTRRQRGHEPTHRQRGHWPNRRPHDQDPNRGPTHPAPPNPGAPIPAPRRPAPGPEWPEVARPEAVRPDVPRPDVSRPEVRRPEASRPQARRREVPGPGVSRPGTRRPEAPGAGVPAPGVPGAGIPAPGVPRPAPRADAASPTVRPTTPERRDARQEAPLSAVPPVDATQPVTPTEPPRHSARPERDVPPPDATQPIPRPPAARPSAPARGSVSAPPPGRPSHPRVPTRPGPPSHPGLPAQPGPPSHPGLPAQPGSDALPVPRNRPAPAPDARPIPRPDARPTPRNAPAPRPTPRPGPASLPAQIPRPRPRSEPARPPARQRPPDAAARSHPEPSSHRPEQAGYQPTPHPRSRPTPAPRQRTAADVDVRSIARVDPRFGEQADRIGPSTHQNVDHERGNTGGGKHASRVDDNNDNGDNNNGDNNKGERAARPAAPQAILTGRPIPVPRPISSGQALPKPVPIASLPIPKPRPNPTPAGTAPQGPLSWPADEPFGEDKDD